MAVISYKDIFAPSFWQAWNDFLNQRYTDMWFTGGRGCIAADTLIATPSGDIPVQDFKGGLVYSYDGESIISAYALPAEKFQEEDLYLVDLDDGSSITVTDQHRFLSPSDGWVMTKELKPGSLIAVARAKDSLPSPSSTPPRLSIPFKFRFPILDKTLFSRQDDSEAAIDTLSSWTDTFTVPESSSALRLSTVVSVQFSHRAPYYDLFVPVYNNYLSANGILNHNSTKSSFVTMCIVLGMIRDSQEAFAHRAAGNKRWMSYLTHAIVYRKVAADLKDSVYNQFVWSIEKLGLTDKFTFRLSPLRITYNATGQMINFKGLDDPIKSKSIKAPFGYYKYNFFEELNQFDGMEEVRNVRQSIMRGGPEGWREAEKAVKNGMIGPGGTLAAGLSGSNSGTFSSGDKLNKVSRFASFCAFNPPESSSHWAVHESRKIVPGRRVYHSDYRSVPRTWLGETFFQQAEILRLDNERAYRHEYLGESTGNGGTVFENVVDRRISDAEIQSWSDKVLWGADFGLKDPTVLLGAYYSALERSLYIFAEYYASGVLLDAIESNFKRLYFGYNYIRADSASPQMIMELENRGLPMLGVTKFKDSIRHGIHFLRNLRHIYIDQIRCPNAFREFSMYEFEKLKGTELFTDRPMPGNDHTVDSCRYLLQDIIENSSFC